MFILFRQIAWTLLVIPVCSASFAQDNNAKDALTTEQVSAAWTKVKKYDCNVIIYHSADKLSGQEIDGSIYFPQKAALSLPTRLISEELVLLTPSLAKLPSLKALDLGNTKIGNEATKSFKSLPELEAVFLDHTSIGDAGLKNIAECSKLTWLDLSNTKVTDAGLNTLATMMSLRVLKLADNPKITDKGLKSLTALSALQILDLSGTGVKLTDGLELSNLQALKRVSLAFTSVGDDGIQALSALKNLNELDLSGTSTSGKGLTALSSLKSLKVLNLKGAAITDEGAAGIAQLKSLRELDLSNPNTSKNVKSPSKSADSPQNQGGVKLTDQGLNLISTCTSLQKLMLARTGIIGGNFEKLSPLTELVELELDETGVTDQSMAALKDMKSLRIVSFAGTKIKGFDLGALAKLPNLQALNLERTLISDVNLQLLSSASRLQDLNLRGTAITSAGFAAIEGLPLARLDISGTKIYGAKIVGALASMKSLRILTVDSILINDGSLGRLSNDLPRCIINAPDRTTKYDAFKPTLRPRVPVY